MITVTMPEMGESVVEGTVEKWLVHAGDRVEKDQVLCEITTDKITRTERVRVARFFAGAMDSDTAIKEAVKFLEDHLLKLYEEGVKIVVE